MNQYITIWWLLGAVIAVIGIIVPTIIHYSTRIQDRKVDKDICLLRHTDLDRYIIEIKETSKTTKDITEDISKNLVRVETLLSKK